MIADLQRLEALHVDKIRRRVAEIGGRVWERRMPIRDVALAETTGHLTPREAARLRFVRVGEGPRWGKPWGTGWFRLRFQVPREFRGETVGVLFDSGGDGLVHRNAQPVQGLDVNRHACVIGDPCRGGEPVELLVEAGVRHPYTGARTHTMRAPELAIFLREVWDAWHDAAAKETDLLERDERRR